MFFRRRFPVVGLALLAALSAPLRSAAAPRWQKVSSPHFTIYTDDSVRKAREWAVNLEAFELGLQQLFPLDDRSLAPVTVVLFRNDRAFRPFKLRNRSGHADEDEAGVFMQWNGRFLIAINVSDEETARRIVFLNATHWYISAFLRQIPLWLETGLAEVYSTYIAYDGRITVGYPIDDCVDAFKVTPLLPLRDLMAVTLGSPYYKVESNAAFFNAESWAFVHCLLQGKKGAWRSGLGHFVRLFEAGMGPVDAFAAAFPDGIGGMEHNFDDYVNAGSYATYVVTTDLAAIEQSVTAGPASEAEVQVALAYLDLSQQRNDEAVAYILRAAALAPNDVRVLEAQADLALARGNNDRAIDFYRRAAAAGSRFYLAHYWPAAQDANSLLGGGAGEGLDAGAARTAADEFERTINLRPTFVPAYEALGGLAAVLGTGAAVGGQFLQQGAQVAPGDPWIESGLAALDTAAGRFDAAHRRLAQAQDDLPTAIGGDPGAYHQKVAARLRAREQLAQLRELMAAGGGDPALSLLSQVDLGSLLPAERRQIGQWRLEGVAQANLARARSLMRGRQWMEAELLLNEVVESDAAPPLKAKARKLLAELARQKTAS